jgi:peroxin-13
MTIRSKFTTIAIAAAVSGAMVLPATSAFAADRTDRALIGAVLGGVAGAALSNGDGRGVALGAVAGAALGASTGHGHRYYRGYRESRPYYRDARYRDYDRRDYGHYGYGRYDTSYDYYGYGYR